MIKGQLLPSGPWTLWLYCQSKHDVYTLRETSVQFLLCNRNPVRTASSNHITHSVFHYVLKCELLFFRNNRVAMTEAVKWEKVWYTYSKDMNIPVETNWRKVHWTTANRPQTGAQCKISLRLVIRKVREKQAVPLQFAYHHIQQMMPFTRTSPI